MAPANAEPALDVGAAGLVIVERCTEQVVRVDRAEADPAHRAAGVERVQALLRGRAMAPGSARSVLVTRRRSATAAWRSATT